MFSADAFPARKRHVTAVACVPGVHLEEGGSLVGHRAAIRDWLKIIAVPSLGEPCLAGKHSFRS